MKIKIEKEIPREVIENVFITALEGGSNYWYWLSDEAVSMVRKAVPKKEEQCLSVAIFKAVYDHGIEVPINDAENEDEELGVISMKTMGERLQKLSDSGDKWALEAELGEDMDASSSDVVFQYLTMGEVVYG
jgi:hypothetical protein